MQTVSHSWNTGLRRCADVYSECFESKEKHVAECWWGISVQTEMFDSILEMAGHGLSKAGTTVGPEAPDWGNLPQMSDKQERRLMLPGQQMLAWSLGAESQEWDAVEELLWTTLSQNNRGSSWSTCSLLGRVATWTRVLYYWCLWMTFPKCYLKG